MGVVGFPENKANSAQLELELGLSLATKLAKLSREINVYGCLAGWVGEDN